MTMHPRWAFARPGVAAALSVACLFPAWSVDTVHAQSVHVYKNARGWTLISDRPRQLAGYTLIRRHPAVERIRPVLPLRPRRSRFDTVIERISQLHDMDAALVKAVVHAESAFVPDAVSHKGAVGLMQLMPSTAAAHGVSDRTDPEQNLAAGTRHLKTLLERYDDIRLALAAYNAGEDAVRRHGGIPPFAETESYVQKVLELHGLYREQG